MTLLSTFEAQTVVDGPAMSGGMRLWRRWMRDTEQRSAARHL